ncbi:hypothetical protein BDZ97DRAFT_1758629 [Flammula alnicola]|nr:hypothetical protein BDZ97DRAFT_1758629 [Flammula alnicola]
MSLHGWYSSQAIWELSELGVAMELRTRSNAGSIQFPFIAFRSNAFTVSIRVRFGLYKRGKWGYEELHDLCEPRMFGESKRAPAHGLSNGGSLRVRGQLAASSTRQVARHGRLLDNGETQGNKLAAGKERRGLECLLRIQVAIAAHSDANAAHRVGKGERNDGEKNIGEGRSNMKLTASVPAGVVLETPRKRYRLDRDVDSVWVRNVLVLIEQSLKLSPPNFQITVP